MKTYRDYIMYHRNGVIRTWEDILQPVLISEGVSGITLSKITKLVYEHDESKLVAPEYEPYSRHFMNPEKYDKHSREYMAAWNHHQKSNPHHWQYWVLMEDIENPKMQALEMDFEYVIEMLCDWQSASTYYGNTANWWYNSQKENMILHSETIRLIEKYIRYLD